MSRLQSRFDLYEPDLVRALRREITCTQTPTFLDVGANIGLISLAVLAACPGVRVEAFDPGPHQSRLLQATIAYNRLEPRVRVHTIALGDADGEVDFAVHTSEHASGDGLIDTGRAGSVTTVRVPMQRLDSWWCAAGQPDARVVKVDTEGAELMILKGAQQFLAACRPTLFLEIWPDNLRNYPYSADDVLAGLNQLGYRLETLYGERVEPRHAATFWGREETYVARPR